LFFVVKLFSQDIHFSQFNENPSLVNPAITAANDVLRASVINRNQWRGVTNAYKTFGASIEMKLKGSNWEQVDKYRSMTFKQKSLSRLSAGLSFYNDKAGDGNMGITQVNLSLATFVPLNNKNSISLGLQGSLVQRKIDYDKLLFPSQYDGVTYDASLLNGENTNSNKFIYPDLSAGIAWTYSSSEKRIASNDQVKANVGVSTYHITQPRFGYLKETNSRLLMKYILHGNFLIDIPNSNIGIAPSYLVQLQGSSKEIVVGTLVKYYIHSNTKYTGLIKQSSFSIGGYYRNNDAVIVSALLEWEQYALCFSYDINTSTLSKVSKTKGGMEVSLRFSTAKAFLYQKR
jgi:type IX secretion system PorP/SprF family membrane protein